MQRRYIPWLVPCIGIVLVCIVVMLMTTSSRIMQSYHGLYHAAYTYQVFHGIIPPSNPLSLGMPANSYWIWHLVLSGFMHVFHISPLQATVLSNCLGMALYTIGMWTFLARHHRSQLVQGSLFCLSFSFSSVLWLLGITHAWDTRIFNGLLSKFFNVNGFCLAIGLLVLIVSISLRATTVKKGNLHSYILGGICFLLTILTSLIHPTTGTALLFFGISGACVHLAYRNSLRNFTVWIGIIVGVLCTFPYALALQQHLATGTEIANARDILKGLLSMHKTGVFITGLVLMCALLRYKHSSKESVTLLVTCAALCLATLLLHLPDKNEYKYMLLLSPFTVMLLSSLWVKQEEKTSFEYRCAIGILGIICFLLLGWNLLRVQSGLFTQDWHMQHPYVFIGNTIKLYPHTASNQLRQEMYDW